MGALDFDATMTPQDLVATDRSFRIEAGGNFILKPIGDPIWAWTDDAAGCPLILGEAP